jgi:hypothetical protein
VIRRVALDAVGIDAIAEVQTRKLQPVPRVVGKPSYIR